MPATITRKSRRVVEDPQFAPPPKISADALREIETEELINRHNAKRYVGRRGVAVRLGPLLDGLAGIAANDPDAGEPWQQSPEGAVQQLDVEDLVRHPDNREPAEQDIVAMMASLSDPKVGQLEPIVVWAAPDDWVAGGARPTGIEVLVILSGETRWRAAKRLGWPTIQGRIASGLTPAEALDKLARYNGERRDLDPMQKARLINRLCQPIAEGGSGLTRQAAGERVGLESGAAASNLVRLLELPKVWQDRVASGELPWTWAREILPFAKLGPVMEHLDASWKARGKPPGASRYSGDTWDTRAEMLRICGVFMHNNCRLVDEPHWTGSETRKLKADLDQPAIREKLGIVEFEMTEGKKGQTKTVLVATDADEFDDMLRKQGQRATKAKAEKVGRDKPAKPEMTPAQRKLQAVARTRQLDEQIAAWRQKLIRRELVCRLDDEDDDGFRLVLAYVAGGDLGVGPDICELLVKASGQDFNFSLREDYWPCVAKLDQDRAREKVTSQIARRLLAEEPRNWKAPIVPPRLLEGYAEALRVSVNAAWLAAQMPGEPGKLAGEDLLEEFFLLHQTDELRDLAKELGKHVPETANKAAMVKVLLAVPRGSNQRLPLPKSIKPIAGVAKGKPKKGAK